MKDKRTAKIDTSDIPEVSEAWFKSAKLVKPTPPLTEGMIVKGGRNTFHNKPMRRPAPPGPMRKPPGDEYLALLCHDKSIVVLAQGATMQDAESERRVLDHRETNLKALTKIARVRVEILEILEHVAAPLQDRCNCPHCKGGHEPRQVFK